MQVPLWNSGTWIIIHVPLFIREQCTWIIIHVHFSSGLWAGSILAHPKFLAGSGPVQKIFSKKKYFKKFVILPRIFLLRFA
jgi:hypothetical protein